MSTTKEVRSFKVGDWVQFRYGTSSTLAQVTEDRGAIGQAGRRLYQVRVVSEPGDCDIFEMPEDELEHARPSAQDTIEYLKRELLSILSTNSVGNGPNVWLTYTPAGELKHTFQAGGSVSGGQQAPFGALLGGNIFEPKKDEVLHYLASFGLDKAEAEDVVAEVGIAPP